MKTHEIVTQLGAIYTTYYNRKTKHWYIVELPGERFKTLQEAIDRANQDIETLYFGN